MKPRRILVLQMKRIGDLVLTAPALADLAAVFPGAEIDLVVDGPCADLAGCLPMVSQVLSYRGLRGRLAVWARAAVGGWDHCLDFTGSDRSALLSGLSGARVRVGYERFMRDKKRWRARAYNRVCGASVRELHTVEFHRALVASAAGSVAMTLPGEGSGALLTPPAAAERTVEALLAEAGVEGPFAVVHPGTARREKFWPSERWVEVIRWLGQRGLRVVMTGTGQGLEERDVAWIREHAGAATALVDLTGRLSLPEVAAVIGRSQLALGVDSMAMHLAAMARVPQVVLFGPTNPFHWRPLQGRAVVVSAVTGGVKTDFDPREKGAEMSRISVEMVLSAVEKRLSDAEWHGTCGL